MASFMPPTFRRAGRMSSTELQAEKGLASGSEEVPGSPLPSSLLNREQVDWDWSLTAPVIRTSEGCGADLEHLFEPVATVVLAEPPAEVDWQARHARVPTGCGHMCACVFSASCTSAGRVPACGGCLCSCTVAHVPSRVVARSRPIRGNSKFTAADSRAALCSLLGCPSKPQG